MSWGWGWRPYVPVAQRRAQAAREMARLGKKGLKVEPVVIDGRHIADTFWGRAWCEHLEQFSDFENRLPRGRTYVRNGSVCHLQVRKGKVVAKVSGSELYDVGITIKTLPPTKWQGLKARCAGQVGSMLQLLQGKLSDHVMTAVTDRDHGLFPLPKEIAFECSCPDWASMCKHVAAVLYGVGARLDARPELLFLLRGVDHTQLVGEEAAKAVVTMAPTSTGRTLDEASVAQVFGIDLAAGAPGAAAPAAAKPARRGKRRAKNSRARTPASAPPPTPRRTRRKD
jgi:uncharacterized Zn finger protein